MENIFAIFHTLQTNQIHQNRIRRIKGRTDFPKRPLFRLYTHNSGLDSASCLSSLNEPGTNVKMHAQGLEKVTAMFVHSAHTWLTVRCLASLLGL